MSIKGKMDAEIGKRITNGWKDFWALKYIIN